MACSYIASRIKNAYNFSGGNLQRCLKISTLIDSVTVLLGIYSKEWFYIYCQRINIKECLYCISKNLETTRMLFLYINVQ